MLNLRNNGTTHINNIILYPFPRPDPYSDLDALVASTCMIRNAYYKDETVPTDLVKSNCVVNMTVTPRLRTASGTPGKTFVSAFF